MLAEVVHPAVGDRPRQGGAGNRHGADLREVVAVEHLVVELEDALQHHRHHDERAALVLGGQRQRRLLVELALEHDRRREADPERPLGEAPGMKERRGDHRLLASAQRDHRQQRGDRVDRLGHRARRALRRAGRPRGEDDRAALLGRRVERRAVAGVDQILEMRVARVALDPRHVALAPRARLLEHVRELLVVDHRLRLLALGDVGELRSAERGVEEECVGPELRAGQRRLDPAAVVAAHDRDRVAGADAIRPEPVRERVRALVELGERERPELVDHRCLVAEVARRRGVARRGRGAEPQQRPRRVPQAVRPLGVHDARARERDERVELRLGLRGDRVEHPADSPIWTAAASPVGSRPS